MSNRSPRRAVAYSTRTLVTVQVALMLAGVVDVPPPAVSAQPVGPALVGPDDSAESIR